MYRVTRRDNGLTIATAEMPHMSSVSLGLWVGVGSRYETAELNGICHFIEHMVFKGTRRRSAREISQAVEGVGGYLNAFTSEEATCFHAKARHDRLPELLDVLTDMILHSRFDPVEIDKEREVIKEEIAMYLDEPQHHVQELLNQTLWPDQPLGRPITGTEKTLDGIGRNELLSYLKGNYAAGNTVFTLAGNVTHRKVLQALAPYERWFAARTIPQFSPAKDGQTGPAIKLHSKKTEQTQLALGIRTCSRHDERRYALRVLNAVLGENMSSRLFQLLREDLGLAYSIYSTPSFFQDAGDLVISAGLDTANLGKALRLIIRELARLKQSGPGIGELRRARDYVLGQIDLTLEGTENQMNWLGEQLLGYGTVLTPTRLKNRLARVTSTELRQVARDFFQRTRLSLALVTSLKSDTEAVRLLAHAL